MIFPTMWYVRPAKAQISLRNAQSDQSICWLLEYYMTVKLLTAHQVKFLRLKGGCTGASESTLVKMPHCWKSHAATQLSYLNYHSRHITLKRTLYNGMGTGLLVQ